MSEDKQFQFKFKTTAVSKVLAALITGALAVFIAVNLSVFFEPEVIAGKYQLLWSALAAVGAGAAELFLPVWSGERAERRRRTAMEGNRRTTLFSACCSTSGSTSSTSVAA